MDDVELLIGDTNTRLGWASVSLVSQNSNGFGQFNTSLKVLVAATGLAENKNMEIEKVDDTHIT